MATESSVAATDPFLDELGILEPEPAPKTLSQPRTKKEPPEKTVKKYNRSNRFVNGGRFLNAPPDPLYIFDEGLRRVNPYHFTYNTYCKQRWRGRTLLDIFTTEFRDRPVEYYEKAIAAGTVAVRSTRPRRRNLPDRFGIDTLVEDGDIIEHTLHRHEPPVTSRPIGIVYEDDGMIVIDKPAGVPVHPTGRYNYNSVTEILKHERPGFSPLPCNRLDRLTSGLMFIAKNRKAADDMMNQLRTRTVRKQYVARVRGEFPDGDVICEQPILTISPKLGLNRIRPDGKPAKTLFRKKLYNEKENYSIVECHPFTGRTHQIRVHLQFLGHPITNDPIYANRAVWGENLGRGGSGGDDEDIITRLNRMGKQELADAEAFFDELKKDYEQRRGEMMTGILCDVCSAPLYSDPGAHELGIYLHAMRYECAEGKWGYETNLPEWALEKQ